MNMGVLTVLETETLNNDVQLALEDGIASTQNVLRALALVALFYHKLVFNFLISSLNL